MDRTAILPQLKSQYFAGPTTTLCKTGPGTRCFPGPMQFIPAS
jgi:hypothetical protein